MVTEKEIVAAFLTLKRLARDKGINSLTELNISFGPLHLDGETYDMRRPILFDGTEVGRLNLEKLADADNLGLAAVFGDD